jgi:hypothetical protein
MKPLVGLLIEYFVIGSVSLLWLLPMAATSRIFHQFNKDAIGVVAAAAVPGLYVIGMVCDYIGYLLINKLTIIKRKKEIEREEKWVGLKDWIETKVWQDQIEKGLIKKQKMPSSQLINVYAVACIPALAGEIEVRSSRDRIARGSVVASLPLLFFSPLQTGTKLGNVLVSMILIVVLGGLWYRFQKLSAQYEIFVWHLLQEKHGVKSMPPSKRTPGETTS